MTTLSDIVLSAAPFTSDMLDLKSGVTWTRLGGNPIYPRLVSGFLQMAVNNVGLGFTSPALDLTNYRSVQRSGCRQSHPCFSLRFL